MRQHRTPGVADVMVQTIGYQAALAFVAQLSRRGFCRGARIPAVRTLRAAELRRLPSTCDVSYQAARLNLRPAELRRRLRRRRNQCD